EAAIGVAVVIIRDCRADGAVVIPGKGANVAGCSAAPAHRAGGIGLVDLAGALIVSHEAAEILQLSATAIDRCGGIGLRNRAVVASRKSADLGALTAGHAPRGVGL